MLDVGVDTPYEVDSVSFNAYQKYDLSGGDISVEPALSSQTFVEAIGIGRQRIAKMSDNTQLLILGEMGIGNTTPSSAVACALLGGEIDDLVGKGTGITEEARRHKVSIIAKALQRFSKERDHKQSHVIEVMRHLGGR